MRTLATVAVLGLALAAAGCSKPEQQKTTADAHVAANNVQDSGVQLGNDVEAVGNDVKGALKGAGAQLKDVAKDPDVKKAGEEVKSALKDLGASVKQAAKESKEKSESANATR
jgi:hypothetical protein